MAWIRLAAFALGLAATVPAALAADVEPWPRRTVRILLPLPGGTGTDLAARLFADRLSQRWKQPVIVENRPGTDGIVGVTAFVNSRDDHTLLFSFAGPMTINPYVHAKLPYDPALDLVPIAPAIDNFFAVAVTSSLGVASLPAFVQRARHERGALNWTATAGLPQYIFAALTKEAGLEMTFVGYRGLSEALQDFGEGRVHVFATGLPSLLGQVQAGKANLLMVTNRNRSPLAPDVPTANEVGYPQLSIDGVVGFYGWRDMPSGLRDRIAADIRAVAADSAIAARLQGIGIVVGSGTPAELTAAIEEQRDKVAGMIRVTQASH